MTLGNVLIVGGSASIAPEIIGTFASGARHLTVTSRTPLTAPAGVTTYVCDLADPDSRELLAEMSEGIDVLLILSGAVLGKNLASTSDFEMNYLVDVNLLGPARILRDLLPVLNTGARVLLMSSISGERGSFDPLYAATKGALIPLAKSLATWLGDQITITVVAPGPIENSAMIQDMSPDRVAHHLKNSPTGKFLTRSDLARVLFDLAHPHWAHTNGSVIRINGGSYV